MRFSLFLLCLLFPTLLFAQGGVITGTVARMDTKTPLGKASVFLSNSSFGTITNDDGSFTLNRLRPGQYDLIVTMLGFEDYSQTILVGKDALKLKIELMPKVTQLHEVVITTPANWKRNYAMFVKEFLGESADARKCTIENPHDIMLIYHKAKKMLEAYSDGFIVIENRALGYKVKLLLKRFSCDDINNIISWEGRILYEELPAKARQKTAWLQRRREIYYGSSMHFFRSLRLGTLNDEGFQMMQLFRTPNPKRPPAELIQKNIDRFTYFNRDSLNYWTNMYNLPKYDDSLNRQLMPEAAVLHKTDRPGIYAVVFRDCLYVVYTKKRENMYFRDIYRPLDMPNYETSVITLYKPYALFDMNGVVVSSQSTLFEGSWSKNKVAELLPVDYVPDAGKEEIN